MASLTAAAPSITASLEGDAVMMRRSLSLVWLLPLACGGPDPEAAEALAVCQVVLAEGPTPDEQVAAALVAASELVTVSKDMREATARYGARDLAEQQAAIAAAARAAGIRRCQLAEGLEALATAAPKDEDMAGALALLEAAPMAAPEHLTAVLAEGCAELPACGRECVPGLSGLSSVHAAERVQSLAAGCAEFRKKVAGGEPALDAFVRARVAAFLDTCAKHDGPDAARIGTMRVAAML